MSGPQRYPGASTAYWYGSEYPGSAMESNVIVWHTTEGTSLPDYSGGSMAPNFTARPNFAARRLEWFQHFDFDVSSRALVNAPGGVETNTLNVCQIEIIGTCDPGTHSRWAAAGYSHLYTPELPDWAIRDLAAFAKWAHDQHGVPLSSGVTFKAYPGSYGANGVRMSGAQWTAFKGHCGHQHVPENDHGDPGAFPMAAILAVAKNGSTQEDDMPTANEVAKAVLTYDGVIAVPGAPPANPTWTLSSVQTEILKRLDQVKATEAAQTAAITALAKLIGSGVDTAAVVTAVQQAIKDAVVKVSVDVTGPQGV